MGKDLKALRYFVFGIRLCSRIPLCYFKERFSKTAISLAWGKDDGGVQTHEVSIAHGVTAVPCVVALRDGAAAETVGAFGTVADAVADVK